MGQYEITTIEVEKTITSLVQELKRIQNTTSMKKKNNKKFEGWIQQLEKILGQISDIKDKILPKIEGDLGYPFSNIDHIIIAMMRPSIKKPFEEIRKHFSKGTDLAIPRETLGILDNSPEIAKTLAWIGDSVIKYAIFLDIYIPGMTTEMLHNKRKSYEENKNLARLCDRWKLFDYRIHLDPDDPKPKSIKKIKGTLVESIYGVIFIEKTMSGIQKAISLVKPFDEKI
jgi:ribonuclease-3